MVDRVDAVFEAQESFKLLFRRRNWILCVPVLAGAMVTLAIVISVLLATLGPAFFRQIEAVVTTGTMAAPFFDVGKFLVVWSVAMIVMLTVSSFSYGWTLAAAEPIWEGQDPALERGLRSAAGKIGQLWIFTLLVLLLAALALITIVGPIIVLVLAIYGPAYILLGKQSATAAIGSSFRLSCANLGDTILLALAMFVVGLVFGVTSMLLSFVPIVGSVAGLAAQCLGGAYSAIATVRFYDLLTKQTLPYPLIPKTM